MNGDKPGDSGRWDDHEDTLCDDADFEAEPTALDLDAPPETDLEFPTARSMRALADDLELPADAAPTGRAVAPSLDPAVALRMRVPPREEDTAIERLPAKDQNEPGFMAEPTYEIPSFNAAGNATVPDMPVARPSGPSPSGARRADSDALNMKAELESALELLLTETKLDEARRSLEKLLIQHPDSAECASGVAYLDFLDSTNVGERERNLERLNAIAEQNPYSPDVIILTARAQRGFGETSQSTSFLRRAVEQHPYHVVLRSELAVSEQADEEASVTASAPSAPPYIPPDPDLPPHGPPTARVLPPTSSRRLSVPMMAAAILVGVALAALVVWAVGV